MIKTVESFPRLYAYSSPIISLVIPGEWVREAAEYDKWYREKVESSRTKGWLLARRVGLRAFASYYGLEEQFSENHDKWYSGKRYVPDYNINGNQFTIQTVPIFEWNYRCGRSLAMPLFRNKTESNLMYVICTLSIPYFDIIGVYPNSHLKEDREVLEDTQIFPISACKILREIDKREIYL